MRDARLGRRRLPIDYANACPDVAVTSLHYYFPWAIRALVRWSAYCVVTGRRGPMDLEMRRYFDIADARPDDGAKLDAYLAIADEYFETEAYWAWCARYLPHLDAAVLEWVQSDDVRPDAASSTVQATYPEHEQERFVAHFGGLLIGLWVRRREEPPRRLSGSPAGCPAAPGRRRRACRRVASRSSASGHPPRARTARRPG